MNFASIITTSLRRWWRIHPPGEFFPLSTEKRPTHSRAPVAVVAACNPLSLPPKHKNGGAEGRNRRDPCADPSVYPPTGSSTELQLLLPFVTCCGRFPGICPLRSSDGGVFCDRCHCVTSGILMFRD
jgi:hypothetical protein